MITFELFQNFMKNNNEKNVWFEYQTVFHYFWENIIMNESVELHDEDIDPIIRMLDQNGKGNTRGSIVVAKAFIRMGMWHKAFHALKNNSELRLLFNEILKSTNDYQLIQLLNTFESVNDERNGLTGKSAVIINAILCLNNPMYYISAVSLKHRKLIFEYLYQLPFSFNTFGEKIVLSNRAILNYFSDNSIIESPRNISLFIYSIKKEWLTESNSLIYPVKHLEDNVNEFNLKVEESLKDDSNLRNKRINSYNGRPNKTLSFSYVYNRNPDIVAEALIRANGCCEKCQKSAPFLRKSDNTPYLEVHHIKPLSEGGLDTLENVIAICPNCHRNEHFGTKKIT